MDGLRLNATARIKLTKLDENGNTISVEEHTTELTKEEVESLCRSQQQV